MFKSAKRNGLVLLIVMCLMVLTACGSGNKDEASDAANPDATSTKAPDSGKKQTLIVYAQDDQNVFGDEAKADQLFGDFKKENNVNLQIVSIKSSDFLQKFTISAQGNEPMDVLFTNGQFIRTFYSKGLIADLTNEIKAPADRFNQSALDTYTYGGKLYALPWSGATTSALYYNKSLFEKYNLKVPTTFDELTAVSKEFNKNGIAPIAFGGGDKFMWPMWYFETFAQASGNDSVNRTFAALQGKAKFTDPDFVEAMEELGKFGKDKILQDGVNGTNMDAARALFIAEKAAMFYGGSWELDGFSKGIADKLDVALFPTVKAGTKVQMTGAGGDGVALYAKVAPEKKDLAVKLIEYFTSDAVHQKYVDISGMALPANKNIPTKGNAVVAALKDKHVPVTVTFLDWYWPKEITEEFQIEIQAVVGQMVSAKDAMAKIQAVYDKIKAGGYDFDSTK
ncbi:sugar ABC transporter substrate-binding protein [Paenibacillus psychroresistens]|uniref:Sugar ABC transporter substrate-binding protein n=1 Tax=Paenibacillus psychroresistens TaxID=1778678 RepID=A0A6B8RVC1_9BACL|nr:sugar ABC transporter substrate-binding protein [Paenibacillus psychroresistens]QGQ99714.1 sugar ABC transporter substrate-binding protein [Paenibacillus psychroresistens]